MQKSPCYIWCGPLVSFNRLIYDIRWLCNMLCICTCISSSRLRNRSWVYFRRQYEVLLFSYRKMGVGYLLWLHRILWRTMCFVIVIAFFTPFRRFVSLALWPAAAGATQRPQHLLHHVINKRPQVGARLCCYNSDTRFEDLNNYIQCS